jgi:hypothetical protein
MSVEASKERLLEAEKRLRTLEGITSPLERTVLMDDLAAAKEELRQDESDRQFQKELLDSFRGVRSEYLTSIVAWAGVGLSVLALAVQALVFFARTK